MAITAQELNVILSARDRQFTKAMDRTQRRVQGFAAKSQKELESICRLYAPIGTWDRFIEYEAKMRKQRKKEAEERQRQIAQTIRYISWGLITVISVGGLSLLYFFTEFLRGLR